MREWFYKKTKRHMLPKVDLDRIKQLLWRFGLNESEQTVYLTWLHQWPSTVAQLAHTSGLKRVTTHAIVDSLISQGLFTDSHRGKKRLVHPHDISQLETLLEHKKFELEQLESQLSSTLPLLQHIKQLSENFPNVRLLQGTEWLNTTLLEIAHDKQDVFSLYDAHSFNELIDERTYQRSFSKRQEHNCRTHMVLPDWFTDFWHIKREDNYNIHIKTVPTEKLSLGWIDIRGHKVALHNYKEWFVTTTILENKEISAIIRCMFDALRSTANDYQWGFVLV